MPIIYTDRYIELKKDAFTPSLDDILIFKTNVTPNEIGRVHSIFDGRTDILKWTLDLEDVDRVLRIEKREITASEIIFLINQAGFLCEELTD